MSTTRTLLLSGAVLLLPAAAFAQAPAAAGSHCDRLVTMLEHQSPANSPVTLDQARGFKQSNNERSCQDAMNNPALVAASGAAQVVVHQATPQVTVQQAQPSVTVNEGQPVITVHQPAPTVTVEIPQPVITIRMPTPTVNVAMAQPQVEVSQAKPQISVVPATQPQVSIQAAPQGQNVTVQNGQQAPKVNYTSDQAKVVVNQPQGAPTVNVEQGNAAPATQTAAAQPGIRPVAAAAASPAPTTSTAASLLRMNVVNAKGDVLGDVERVLTQSSDKKSFVVIGHGGFLGLGEKQVALPLDSMFVRDGKLVMRGMSDDQIRAMPTWTQASAGYSNADGNTPVQVSTGN